MQWSQSSGYLYTTTTTNISFFLLLLFILNLWILHAYCNVFITVVQPSIPIQMLSSSLDVFHVKLSQKKYCWKPKSQVVRKRTEALLPKGFYIKGAEIQAISDIWLRRISWTTYSQTHPSYLYWLPQNTAETDRLMQAEVNIFNLAATRVAIPCNLKPFLDFTANGQHSLAGRCSSFSWNTVCCIWIIQIETNTLSWPFQPYSYADTFCLRSS